MTDTEKVAALRKILQPIIKWYRITEAGEVDGSYLYDVTVDEFERCLRRGDYQQIIEILK